MAELVYISCGLLSVLCAGALLWKFRTSGMRLLLWSGICFLGLAANNILLFVDKIVMPDADLSVMRIVPALIGVAVLLYGLIWDAA